MLCTQCNFLFSSLYRLDTVVGLRCEGSRTMWVRYWNKGLWETNVDILIKTLRLQDWDTNEDRESNLLIQICEDWGLLSLDSKSNMCRLLSNVISLIWSYDLVDKDLSLTSQQLSTSLEVCMLIMKKLANCVEKSIMYKNFTFTVFFDNFTFFDPFICIEHVYSVDLNCDKCLNVFFNDKRNL